MWTPDKASVDYLLNPSKVEVELMKLKNENEFEKSTGPTAAENLVRSPIRLDIDRIVRRALLQWRGILVLGFLGAFLAGIYTALATPIYSATAILMPPPGAGSDAVLSQLKNFAKNSTSLPLISDPQSRFDLFQALLTTDTISRLMLDRYDFKYEIFERSWDSKKKEWHKNLPPVPAVIDWVIGLTGYSYWNKPDASQMTKYIKRNLSQSVDLNSGMLQLEFTDKDPVLAQKFLSALISETDKVIRNSDMTTLTAVRTDLQKRFPSIAVQSLLDTLIWTANDLEVQISQASVGKSYSMTLIQPATSNEQAVWPRPLLLIVGGAIIGMLLGVMSAALGWMPTLNKGSIRKMILARQPNGMRSEP